MQSSAFREMPYMGVIFVVVEAMKLGYSGDSPAWSNLGQGQPEPGPMEGAPTRMAEVPVLPGDYAYGPVEGIKELREVVAAHYNRLYRRGMKSQYTYENVVIAAGGRTMLTRTVAALDSVKLGYFTPDYTAYEDLLSNFQRVTPFHIQLLAENKFSIAPEELRKNIEKEKLGGLLISNPCNPTGRVVSGNELQSWVEISRGTKCTMLLDEYYSHFIWNGSNAPVSSAAFIEDVNTDPVVIIDGLTKNYRYPGWRCGWAIGPKDMVKNITAAGSFVDGGPPRPIQRAAIEILEPKRADQETNALRQVFSKKRDLMLKRLKSFGVEFPLEPESTFYSFGSVAKLPAPFNEGMNFFREALKHKVLTVPGEFFDVNPNKVRKGRSPLTNFVRFSFGPPLENVSAGLDRLGEMLGKVRG